jgi:ATP-dependent Clp protease ATP-binding subunit ClpC
VIFTRFAREARACVEAAVEEARMLGHDSVGDEDLLIGILRAGEGTAAEALSYVGISFEDVRTEAGDAFDMRIPEGRRIPFAPGAKKGLEQALREAVRLKDNRIGAEHVLLGVLRNDDGTAVRMLGRLGVSPEALEDRLYALRGRAAG